MDYRKMALAFLERSKEEQRRLESEIRTIGDIIRRLESLVAGEPSPDAPPVVFSTPPDPIPPLPMEGHIPVGEAAEILLRERVVAMSLEELFRTLGGRADIAPSRDLKNAIRVALIRRRPRIVSERRGWFRFAGEASTPGETDAS